MMMSAKMATSGLLKMKILYKKGYDVIIFAHDVTNKILSLIQIIIRMLSCDQSLVTLAFL